MRISTISFTLWSTTRGSFNKDMEADPQTNVEIHDQKYWYPLVNVNNKLCKDPPCSMENSLFPRSFSMVM